MNKGYQAFFLMMVCAVILGCQYVPGSSLFRFGPNDEKITEAVHYVLAHDKALEPFKFHVESASGVVYISGIPSF
jgi:hyperosmotically inducible periplasmic protein